ncbi:MAG: hypothetical protein ACFHWZ_13090 [Phycisphaerales bacterium]
MAPRNARRRIRRYLARSHAVRGSIGLGSTTRTSGSTSAVAPAWAVLAVTWLGSIGTAVGWSGVFFITEVAYGFDERSNLILGAGLGLVYAISALVAGPVVTRLIDARPGLSRRAVLALVCTGMGAAAMIPASTPDVWAIWVFAGVFITLQGLMWPLVEAYLSGGRRGRAMRSITGRFNIVWASAIVVAMWGMAVFMENQPRLILGLLGVAMFATAVLLAWFPREPRRTWRRTRASTRSIRIGRSGCCACSGSRYCAVTRCTRR